MASSLLQIVMVKAYLHKSYFSGFLPQLKFFLLWSIPLCSFSWLPWNWISCIFLYNLLSTFAKAFCSQSTSGQHFSTLFCPNYNWCPPSLSCSATFFVVWQGLRTCLSFRIIIISSNNNNNNSSSSSLCEFFTQVLMGVWVTVQCLQDSSEYASKFQQCWGLYGLDSSSDF